ncbi:DUF2971 domain-containing protein [Aeromonas veronii]|uniref:DUF2971 domain-containing protein n=1 Tax=Aeromonas veronii TaxID=654 RepID=UPI001F2E6DD6|nr:DUF2971 domain-containing protein [Aeromonas veronii]MCF5873921.1 DUF2971 domain-containing protein [Aeromonas veronii]
MSTEYPEFFYKYRPIDSNGNFQDDYAIDALIKNKAIFSSRTNFNDLFDSKIELIKPTPFQLKEIMVRVNKHERNFIRKLIHNGEFTYAGIEFIQELESKFNKLIDSYAFYCISSTPTSNLMWSHYANSHKGFCIEFKSKFMPAEKVIYQDEIPKLNITDIFLSSLNLISGEDVGMHIWQCLRTKLIEWNYESEYRFQANNSMGRIPADKQFIIIPYNPDFVESVIFGCRMPPDAKQFIIDQMPSDTKFKQAVERVSCIEILKFNCHTDL